MTETDPIERLLTALADPKLTPGPWCRWGGNETFAINNGSHRRVVGCDLDKPPGIREPADADFIAACRDGVPALRDALRKYGEHTEECEDANMMEWHFDKRHCRCGWSALKAALDKGV